MSPAASASSEDAMSAEYVVGLAIVVLLLVYLVYALLRPEKF